MIRGESSIDGWVRDQKDAPRHAAGQGSLLLLTWQRSFSACQSLALKALLKRRNHYRNPKMQGDLTGEVIQRLHAAGIRVIGRSDSLGAIGA